MKKGLKIIITSAFLCIGLQNQFFSLATEGEESSHKRSRNTWLDIEREAKKRRVSDETDFFVQLPQDFVVSIFSLLNENDFLRASHTCHEWRQIASIVGNDKSLNLSNYLSNRKLSQEDCQAYEYAPFSALVIEGISLDYDEFNALVQIKQLKKLTLNGGNSCELDDERGKILASGDFTSSLTSLNLSGNHIYMSAVIFISIGNFTHLTSLKAQSCIIRDAAATAIALGKLTNLTSLDLAKNEITEDGATAIAHSYLIKIKYLNLAENKINEYGMEDIVKSHILTNLVSLNLAYNPLYLTEDTMTCIANGNFPNLTSLDLRGNGIREEDIEDIRKCGKLTTLII